VGYVVLVGRRYIIQVVCALNIMLELMTGAICSESGYSTDYAYDDREENECGDEDE
jgi:hypothetical protein